MTRRGGGVVDGNISADVAVVVDVVVVMVPYQLVQPDLSPFDEDRPLRRHRAVERAIPVVPTPLEGVLPHSREGPVRSKYYGVDERGRGQGRGHALEEGSEGR